LTGGARDLKRASSLEGGPTSASSPRATTRSSSSIRRGLRGIWQTLSASSTTS